MMSYRFQVVGLPSRIFTSGSISKEGMVRRPEGRRIERDGTDEISTSPGAVTILASLISSALGRKRARHVAMSSNHRPARPEGDDGIRK